MRSKTKYNHIGCLFCLTAMLLLPLFSLGNDQIGALFKKANALYAKEQYQQAAKIYQQIISDGYQSENVYFNTGNAYYKLDDMPSAILYYEKAQKLAPNDKDIDINLQFANRKTADKIEPQQEFFLARWWQGFILFLSIDTLSILSDLLFLGGFILLAAYLFARSVILKKACFYTGIIAVFWGLASIFMANRQVDYFDTHHQAIVFSSSVIVKGSPNNNAKPLFVLHEGTKVNVTQNNGNWIAIELPNGNAGWITADNVKGI